MDTPMLAETITLTAADGTDVEAYSARPLGPGPFAGVVVIHHMPGFDRSTKEIVRTFATRGYHTVCPNLFHRYAPGASTNDAARAAFEAGGVPDDQMVGDVGAAVRHLRAAPTTSGRVGVIGYCSGGRQAYVAAARVDVDAAIDCYGGRVVPSPEEIAPGRPPAIDLTAEIRCPLLGLFGAEDTNPSPEQVEAIAAALRAHGKEYDFHTLADAGHAFFSVDRPSYRVDAARDGWGLVWRFFERHLAG